MSETIGKRHALACRYKKRGTGGLTSNGTQFDRNSYQPQCVSTRFSESKPDANAYRLIEEIEPGIIGEREILGRSSGS